MKYTVDSISKHVGLHIIGQVVYLSEKQVTRQQLGQLSRRLPQQSWYQELEGKFVSLDHLPPSYHKGFMMLEELCRIRSDEKINIINRDDPFSELRPEREPEWVSKLSPDARGYLQISFARTDGMDPLAILPKVPFMGFGYIIPDEGMARDAVDTFSLYRLAGVRQLSFLSDPVLKSVIPRSAGLMFDHNRYCHSIDVYVVANLGAHNLKVKEEDLNTLLTAAISHDALTPAGGDSVKLIDPKAFDEDAHYHELLHGEAWENYRERYGINPELLVKTVNGEGLLGRILDFADKSAYLARDVKAYLRTESPQEPTYVNTGYRAMGEIVEKDPHVFALWESVYRRGEHLVFGDKERLGRFLTLRALMFRELYHNPFSRFFEYLVGKGIVKWLYNQGRLTREKLLRERDQWLEQVVGEALGIPYFFTQFYDFDSFRTEECPDLKHARARMAEFESNQETLVILDDFAPVVKSAVDRFSVQRKGEIVSFSKAFPRIARDVEDILNFPKKTKLFFFNLDELRVPIRSRALLKKIMADAGN